LVLIDDFFIAYANVTAVYQLLLPAFCINTATIAVVTQHAQHHFQTVRITYVALKLDT